MNKRKQYLATFVVSLGGLSLGVCLGWNSSSSELLKNYMNVDSLELGLVGGIFNLGVCIGLISIGFLLKRFSRIKTMMLTVPIIFLGWICIIFAGQTVALLLTGRILCGFSGTFTLLSPLYISEICDLEIRGKLLSILQLSINIGIMYSYVIAYLTSNENTIWLYSIICGLTTLPISLIILLPESAIYYLKIDNDKKAEESLKYFQYNNESNNDLEMKMEMINLKRFIARTKEQSNKITLKTFKEDKKMLKNFILSMIVMTMHQFSGTTPFIYYTLAIFNLVGSTDISSIEQTLILGSIQIISSILATTFIDIFGRKPLLVVSSFLTFASLILLGWFFKIQKEDPEYADKLSWMPLTWICMYMGSFNLGIGQMAWIYTYEINSYHTRLDIGITTCFYNWLLSLILTLSFGEILDFFGESITMWFFAIFTISGTIFTILFINETKYKPFIDFHLQEDHEETTDSTQL